MESKKKREKRNRRHKRVRARIKGTGHRPRLCVFRSLKHIYAQLVDDEKRHTVVSASDLEIKKEKKNLPHRQTRRRGEKETRVGKIAIAFEVGKLIAEKALKKKIERVVFDRGGFAYHGRLKALAEGAREGGLKF